MKCADCASTQRFQWRIYFPANPESCLDFPVVLFRLVLSFGSPVELFVLDSTSEHSAAAGQAPSQQQAKLKGGAGSSQAAAADRLSSLS